MLLPILGLSAGISCSGGLVKPGIDGGTLRATDSFTLDAHRGIALQGSGGTLHVDADRYLRRRGAVTAGQFDRLQPLVRGGHGHQRGLAPAHAGIHGSPALDEAFNGHSCRCDVLPRAHLSPPNLARHDHLGLPGHQVGCRQAREKCLVQIANGSQAVQLSPAQPGVDRPGPMPSVMSNSLEICEPKINFPTPRGGVFKKIDMGTNMVSAAEAT